MEFTLYYRGELKANRGAKDKQKLRRHFHEQLKALWQQPPLVNKHFYFDKHSSSSDRVLILKSKGGFDFVPLVSENLNLVAELRITMLRPSTPGAIIQSGDIDNRLKTLLDALKIPSEPTALPRGDSPKQGEDPFFCLLEDDSLITKISVETDRLLEEGVNSSEVILLIHVTTKVTETTFFNKALG